MSIRALRDCYNKTWVKIAVLHLLVLAILICRKPQAVVHAQFWAEDGSTFFADQLNFGFWHALVVPYAGYLLVIPRFLAGAFSLLKVAWVPMAYDTSALVIATVCCSALSWTVFRSWIYSDTIRFLACLLAAAAIPVGTELIGSLCDIQWFLAPFALLLLFADWQSAHTPAGVQSHCHRRPIEMMSIVGLVLIALTAPVLLVIIPLLLWQFVRTRGWKQIRAAIMLLALAIQLAVLTHAGAATTQHHLNFDALLISTVAACLAKSILGTLLGRTFLAGSARSIMTTLILTLIITVNLMTALYIYLGRSGRRVILLTAAYVAVAAVAVAIVGRNLYSAFSYPTYIPLAEGYRYFFVSSCLFIFIAALGIDHVSSHMRRPAFKWLVILIFVAAFSPGIVRNFRTPPLADLSWPSYAIKIEVWESQQEHHQPVNSMQIPINPAPFQIRLDPHN